MWSPFLVSDVGPDEDIENSFTRTTFAKIHLCCYQIDYITTVETFTLESLEYAGLNLA